MRRRIAVPAVLVVVIAGIIGGLALTHTGPFKRTATAPPAPPPVPVVATTVVQHDVPIYLTGVGTVIAYNTVVVRSQIQGQLVSVNFTEGQAVHKDDLLGLIDQRPYTAQIDQLTATRDRDQAQLSNALANQARYVQLGDKGWATPQLVETQNAQVAQLQSAIKADEALIDAAKVQLSYTRLTSPIDGIVGIRQIDIGNIVHPTDPNGLAVVTQMEPISLIFTLPEAVLPQIQQEQQRLGHSPVKVIAYSQDNTIKLDEGTLGLVNNEILQTTGSIQLKANFPNHDHRLWPGQLVNARLLVDTRKNGLTVPAAVVQQGPQGAFAYVVNPDKSVEVRPIKVAQITEGQALIDSGLKANETVVTDGQYKLKPGVQVTLLTGKAAKEAEAQTAEQAPIP
jgi:membrane fusion protein, multidrug efflux system